MGITWAGVRTELIFDEATGAILGTRRVQVDPRPGALHGEGFRASPPPGVGVNAYGIDDPGTVFSSSTILEAGVVRSLPPPTGHCG